MIRILNVCILVQECVDGDTALFELPITFLHPSYACTYVIVGALEFGCCLNYATL